MNRKTPFRQQCYELLKQIPEGKVTTYSEIARALGTRAWRAVGTAMAQNEQLVKIPCHRVVRGDGSIGQYALGADAKAELLRSEGVLVDDHKVADLAAHMYRFQVS